MGIMLEFLNYFVSEFPPGKSLIVQYGRVIFFLACFSLVVAGLAVYTVAASLISTSNSLLTF